MGTGPGRDWLSELLAASGFAHVGVTPYAERNLRFHAVRARGDVTGGGRSPL